jgi:hypothetical protein
MPAPAQKKQEQHKSRGGVSPRPNANATRDLQQVHAPTTPINKAAAFPGFVNHGGPVVATPLVYASFWGSLWTSDAAHLTRAARLTQFLTDLVASQYMNVLSQYGASTGAGSGACYLGASFVTNVPNNITDAQIRALLQTSINSGVVPQPGTPANTCVIIYFADNLAINDPADGLVLCEPSNDTAFGYHDFFTTTAGPPMYYAVIPGLSDACLKQSCPTDSTCSLHLAETQEQRQTQVTSHEFGEMVSDPQLNAWYDPSAGEEGDICNGESASITVGANTWNVQKSYSKADDVSSNGATVCVATHPSPLPKLAGVSAAHAAMSRVQQLQAVAKILPLPNVYFDAETKAITRKDAEVKAFAEKLLHPFHHSDVVPNMPGLLRHFADMLEKTAR